MADGMRGRFSVRYGFHSPQGDELIREDAPERLRVGLLQIVHTELDMKPSWIRRVVCGVLRVRENPDNWTEYPNVWNEVQGEVYGREWYKVYDIIEGLYNALTCNDEFEEKINQLLIEENIGWQLVAGELHIRGDDAFEQVLDDATEALGDPDHTTAASELNEAIRDLSRRPKPDLSGAVHHAMAALECVARQASGDEKSTLGKIIKENPGLIPPPVDEAVSKLWGFASEQARHGKVSRELDWEEVQLVVGISAVLSSYLVQKKK